MISYWIDIVSEIIGWGAWSPAVLGVAAAALFAGFIDSIVGGGGLVLTPALFSAFPQAAPATLLGTNKSTSVWGTSFAAWRYQRQVAIAWRAIIPALVAALAGSWLGAWLLTWTSPDLLRKALPWVLSLVLLYTLLKKDMGTRYQPLYTGRKEVSLMAAIGLTIGFYDGFFGPGTGSFFIFLLVRLLGYDFLYASVHAKLLNVATNLAAIALFASKGHVWWHLVPILALANVMGSVLGTRLALKHGAGLVRGVFIAVVLALIVKTALDAYSIT